MVHVLRPLALLVAAVAVLFQTAALGHDHDSDAVPCEVCIQVSHVDMATPPVADVTLILPVPKAVVLAFEARTAIRPPTTVVPPGRAPPVSR